MKKTESKKIIIYVVLIAIIMGLSIFARVMAGKAVEELRGEYYYDPEEELPYLTEMDSYYHLRMTEDIIDYGQPGEAVRDNENWDYLSYAPYGRSAADYSPLMANIAVFLYNFLNGFGASFSLYQIIYMMGAVLSALVVIPVFVLAEKMAGGFAAVIASIIAAVNYGYFIHTVPGFYDTDMLISFSSCFMLCFGLLFVESLTGDNESGKGSGKATALRVKQVIYGVLFALSIFILYRAWNVYSLYVGIFGAALVIFFVAILIKGRKDKDFNVKRNLASPIVLLGMMLFIVVMNPGIFKSVIGFAGSVFAGSSGSLFPDAYVSVSEMRKPALWAGGFTGLFQMKVLSDSDIGIINAVGGSIPFLTALCSAVTMVVALVKKKVRFDYVLMVVWFLVSSVLALRSFRFIVLFALPVSILAGVFAGKLAELMSTKKMMDWKIFAGMVAALLLFPAIYGTYRSLGDSMPIVNQGMGDSITYIRDNTPENTIIASWWDYGYFYEQKAKRRTIFDGGSQNGMRVFWVGRALSTDDEVLSSNILRMVSGSGDKATDEMLSQFGNDSTTLDLMLEALSMDEDSAKELLQQRGAGADAADMLTGLLFPETDDPVMCLITPDMYGICGWFSKFGFWNEKEDGDKDFAVLFNQNEYKPNDGKSGWRFYADGKETELYFEESEDGYKAYTRTKGDNADDESAVQPYPVRDVIVREYGGVKTYDMDISGADNSDKTLTVFLDYDMEYPVVSVMTTQVSDSVFGKLFYLDGVGLDHYRMDYNADGSCKVYELEF